ncbi:DNA helicase-2 / ATP-dependent DNA helicase PcrA [Alkalispirochaeta americana]|uniref:DNA 3'-5' helicase n=2 Tax=Alkalispirochaeta americana TaxID=159291 RepID=A0A1N6N3Y6_9SPIO|nr:DNA helicase-2 / ATP-dependent DNA helicase PcrA [Alkalispirochaeta americana]
MMHNNAPGVTASLQQALAGLNPGQREAVLHQSSPLLILAGAGSGKTRVITVKIAYQIEALGHDPRSILAVTFTNKAAGEMRERAAGLAERAGDVTIRTFHSFGAWMLRRNADVAGLPRGFSIYDDSDAVSLLHSLFPERKRPDLARYSQAISRAKDYCLTPEDDLLEISEDPDLPRIYAAYQKRLEEIGNVDFGDLIMRPVKLLESEPAVAQRLQSRFRSILVDEYQDSNVAQYRLLRALCDQTTFVCVVGDDDQSIYRFRGAEVQNILSFSRIFPGTRVVKLEQNYRSTAPILDLAGAVVARNEGRLGKHLYTERTEGDVPRLILLGDQDQEVSWVIEQVRSCQREDRPGVTAVLYRTNAQSRPFETALLREGIPYRIVGSLRFYEREEVKDAVAFLRFLANPRDEVGFRRIVNKPARGIGAKTLDRLLQHQGVARGDLRRACEYGLGEVSKKAALALKEFLQVFDEMERRLEGDQDAELTPAGEKTLASAVEHLLEISGLSRYHQEQDQIAGTQKLQNLEELVNAASLYPLSREGLVEFLEAIELDSSRDVASSEDARVVLITMHNTKGLEFDRVIITGLEEGLFPRNDDPRELEEERRLFYVAVTRAHQEVTLTSCRRRRLHGRFMDLLPSRFLAEIPRDLVQVESFQGGDRASLQDGSPWQKGTPVYHDDYGSGIVIRSWQAGAERCVEVRFETGMTGQFFPAYDSSLERVAGAENSWGDSW